MFHKEGHKILIFTLFICIALNLAASLAFQNVIIHYVVFAVTIVVFFLIAQFFRNPTRIVKQNNHHILSPVDGKVVAIEEVVEPEYAQKSMRLISVFMSPINVHVTRYPIGGEVVYSKYHKGKYLVAWHPKSSELNERTTVVIKTENFGEVLYRQIAGALARRIVNYATPNTKVQQGTDSGFIKFGSRVDVYIPLDAEINVKIGDVVKGAKSVLAKSQNND
ncbi:phosphatidylserine decarboxylase family protein [Psychroflexus sp. ALD_RP9]|uniref:phosphatidylserine decarboxylase family protein n=1 Tax=Psychroflexus sp. ALD_RP9 TaxID=2777186 RepID=UPI001A90844D|nr:phosphatidylserine decarboxylase family protein [Psychroflexus sp. ALD_RP9]QSS97374.1 phosphatidylserine decarboxylase family protein [Psychroflexus sp. ALD_RP9]